MKRLALLCLPFLIVLHLSAPAEAATRGHGSAHDRVGDAPSNIDITRVTVTQTATKVSMRLHVRNLDKSSEAIFAVSGTYYRSDYGLLNDVSASTWVDRHHRVHVVLYEGEDGSPAHCNSLRAHWQTKKNLVTISSPVRCGAFAHWSGRTFAATSTFAYGHRIQGNDNVRKFKIR